MDEISQQPGDRIIVCVGCAGGAELARSLDGRLRVETAACLNVCDAPVSVAVRAEGKAAYLFAGVDAAAPQDLVAFARLYADSTDGEIADARATGKLRFCLLGRIPA